MSRECPNQVEIIKFLLRMLPWEQTVEIYAHTLFCGPCLDNLARVRFIFGQKNIDELRSDQPAAEGFVKTFEAITAIDEENKH